MIRKGPDMAKYNDLTIEQIRAALDHMEANYGFAMDCQAYGLAAALKDKIDGLMEALTSRIRAMDPYASEADIRFFEGLAY